MLESTTAALKTRMDAAAENYGPPASSHESLGVLVEEIRELEDAIHGNRIESIRWEALDVAAVAIRCAEACDNPGFRKRSGCE